METTKESNVIEKPNSSGKIPIFFFFVNTENKSPSGEKNLLRRRAKGMVSGKRKIKIGEYHGQIEREREKEKKRNKGRSQNYMLAVKLV